MRAWNTARRPAPTCCACTTGRCRRSTALAPQHRLALTLRYLDDLPVADVAAALDRTLHATEALLVRARSAFRTHYETTTDPGEEAGRA